MARHQIEQIALDCWGRYAKLFALDKSCDPAAEQHFRRTLTDVTFMEPYLAALSESERQKIGDQYWVVELLGTHPDFRRRKVGKTMLQWGFERAREDNVPLALIATVIGEKLYLSTGFKEVNRIDMLPEGNGALSELDVGDRKGKGMSWAVMVWEPEGMHRDESGYMTGT